MSNFIDTSTVVDDVQEKYKLRTKLTFQNKKNKQNNKISNSKVVIVLERDLKKGYHQCL